MSVVFRRIIVGLSMLVSYCYGQTAPSISKPIIEGQSTVVVFSQKVDTTYTAVKISVCVSPTKIASCTQENYVPTAPPAPFSGDSTGKVVVNLKSNLEINEWVTVAEELTTTKGNTTTMSDPIQVQAITPASITSSMSTPIRFVNGIAQVPSATTDSPKIFSEVKVYICTSPDKTKVGTDCSSDAAMRQVLEQSVAGGPTDYVDVTPSGAFSATLKNPITGGAYLWVTEKATNAAGESVNPSGKGLAVAAGSSVKPTIDGPIKDGQNGINGSATPSLPTGDKVMVNLCIRTAQMKQQNAPCVVTGYPAEVDLQGRYTLPHTMREGEIIVVQQRSASPLISISQENSDSDPVLVAIPDNERVYTDFVAGVLLSQGQKSFSEANVFMALNVDYALYRPGWYSQSVYACNKDGKRVSGAAATHDCKASRHPGLNSFFQVRLSAIPVNSTETTTTTPSGSSPVSSYDTFLASRKTAHFEMGMYLPMYFGRTGLPTSALRQAFFIAPIARFGFNTLVANDAGQNSTDTTAGTTTTVSTKPVGVSDPSTSVYSFGLVGLRMGAANLKNGSAQTVHYLDLGVGKFSNLRNLYCRTNAVNDCLKNGVVDPTQEDHYTPFRIMVEGYMDVDGFILGFGINKGVNWSGFHRPPNARPSSMPPSDITQAKDDVRFLLGYRLDLGKLMSSIHK